VVRVRDSKGRATQVFEQITIRELGTPTVGALAAKQAQAKALAQRLGHGPVALARQQKGGG
jgi:hypothetical protein